MASKTISITNEVYDLLSKFKLPDESFGDTIKRVFSEKLASHLISWVEENTLWSDMDDEEIKHLENVEDEITYRIEEVDL
ncbi:MAG: antitoxin VapB family protein [Candidatus Heimdallarchaeota archaeon]|nr:antitoxin VapB family protein [Candidatus Heimdallarchaeota archaeon]